jgi:hypothetical protein
MAKVSKCSNGYLIEIKIEDHRSGFAGETEITIGCKLKENLDGYLSWSADLKNTVRPGIARIHQTRIFGEKGQGLGKILVEETEKKMRELGVKEIQAISEPDAVVFWQKMGYQVDFKRDPPRISKRL